MSKYKTSIQNFRKPAHSEDTLAKKFIKAGFWAFCLRGFSQLFLLVRLIILARILAPQDFGLMGIALLAITTFEAISQIGFHQALIHKKTDISNYLNTAWTISIFRGVILFLILWFSALPLGNFLNAPESRLIIQILGISIIFQAFTNIGIVYFQKELEFYKQFLYELSGTLIDFIVAVTAAWLLKSVWALVLGFLAGSLTRFLVSYVIHPFRPRLKYDSGQARELFHFGKWIFISVVVTCISAFSADISVGKFLGVTALGFFRMAFQISNTPATEISSVISKVAFPAYAKIQDQPDKLQNAYFQVLRITTAIAFPISMGIICLAPDFTTLFLGEKWLPIVPVMQILATAGLIKLIISTGSPLFTGSGFPQFEFYTQLIRSIVMLAVIYPLTIYFGIAGAAVGVILGLLAMFVIWYPLSKKITKASWRRYTNAAMPPFLCSVGLAGSIYLLKLVVNPIQSSWIFSIIRFGGITLVGILCYLTTMYLLQKYYHNSRIVDDVKSVYKSLVIQ